MNKILFLFLLVVSLHPYAQNNDCLERLLSKQGSWGKSYTTNNATASDAVIQKKFLDAAHQMIRSYYNPMSVVTNEYFSYAPQRSAEPVNHYLYSIMAFNYVCKGESFSVTEETSTRLDIKFNSFNETPLYDTTDDYQLTGYFDLRHGLPVEIKPGIWQFPDDPEPLGFGRTGNSKLWLISIDGKVPWSYVTRREFLLKRKQNLLRQLKDEEPRLKEQLGKWEVEKKYKEEEWKNDATRLTNYINVTYKPGIDREQQNYKRSKEAFEKAIEKVEEQLAAPETELNKPAIVIRSSKNHLDYEFTDKVEPFAEVLTKPNPAYFNRGLQRSVPQFICIEIIYDHLDSIATRFARSVNDLIDLDYLKSFIGKTAPGNWSGKPAIKTTAQTITAGKSKTENNVVQPVNKTAGNNNSKAISDVSGQTKTTGKAYTVSGTLSAPTGTLATINCNGSDLSVSVPRENKISYNTAPFSFTKPVTENAPYEITVKKIPSNMKAVVYKGSGTAPVGVDQIKIAADYTYELLTRSSNDKAFSTFYESRDVAIGGYKGEEGRYVAFVSLTAGLEGSNGKYRQIFWRDRNTGVTKMISVSSTGEQGNADSYAPSLSADGKLIVFESNASNLVDGDNNKAKDIFLWNANDNKIELVSNSQNGSFADAESFDPAISGNGQFVVFTSSASNLTNISKGQSITNVFVRDLQAGKTEMISIDAILKTGGNGTNGSISFDGSRVSFCSASNTLTKDDTNGLWDLFLWQRGQKELKRISMTWDGKEHNQGEESATRRIASCISGNGRYVAYATTSNNIVPNDNNKFQDVFVYDIETGKVIIASQTSDGNPSDGDSPIEQGERVAISYDGTWVAFPTKATNLGASSSNIILHNMITGKKQIVTDTKGSYVSRPAISYSGSYVVFGKSEGLDNRFSSSGMFAHFTGNGPCRDCKE